MGRESRAPTWVVTRPVNHRPSIPIGRSRVDPDGTKLTLGSLHRTLAHSFSPLPLPRRSESLASKSEKATALPRAPSRGARDHRRVDVSLSNCSSAGSFIACEPATTSPRASTTAPSRTTATSHSRWWRRPLPARRPVKQRRPWRVPSPQLLAAARDLPTRRVDPSTAGDGGHGVNTKKVSPETLTHSSSSHSLFFYPNLDLRASLALVPL
jgi:hypothetical protein